MKFKKTINKVHLWLGLTSGLVVFIIAVTGCLYAFQEEIQDLTQSYRFVEHQEGSVLLPSQLKAIAENELPGKKVHAVLYPEPGHAAEVIFYNIDPEYYYLAYLNPFTGKVLEVKNAQTGFFPFILEGHFYLWLPPEIGQPVVATATLVFVVMVISGIVLWWPKNKKATKQRFSIRWNTRWRRRNYDLHNILGFYTSWIAIILALTGLVWGFEWFATGYYGAFGGDKSLMYTPPVSTSTTPRIENESPAMDRLYVKVRAENPTASIIEVHAPEDSLSAIEVSINPNANTYWKTDYRYFDQNTLEELSVDHIYGKFANASFADKMMRMNYDLHTGAVLGIPGKILTFFASLIIASLPITGFYIWWGRSQKEKVKTTEKSDFNKAASAKKKEVVGTSVEIINS